MDTRNTSTPTYDQHVKVAHDLEGEAWAAFNSAFHAPDAEEYRQAGRDLYRRVLEEKVRALFSRGDEQNRLLDDRLIA